MQKLGFQAPSKYFINKKKYFNGTQISEEDLIKAFNFAHNMCFGEGFHRNHRTGGQAKRKNGEKFCNTFQGKLAEIVLFNFFTSNNLNCSPVDYRIMGEREWDDSDFTVNQKHINVKSAAFFSNLLLLEQNDWNNQGHYIPNFNNGHINHYHFFVLVRIKPDIKKILRTNRLFYSDIIEKETLTKLIFNETWHYDLPGFISHDELVREVIEANHVLPQNSLLNGTVKMDASNYYIQSGDLNAIYKIGNLITA